MSTTVFKLAGPDFLYLYKKICVFADCPQSLAPSSLNLFVSFFFIFPPFFPSFFAGLWPRERTESLASQCVLVGVENAVDEREKHDDE